MLNELAAALVSGWTAQWVWAQTSDIPLFPTFEWVISDQTLGVQIGDMCAFFRDDGRRFKDKRPTEDPLLRIEDAEPILRDPNVLSASFAAADEALTYSFQTTAGQTLYERVTALLDASRRIASDSTR